MQPPDGSFSENIESILVFIFVLLLVVVAVVDCANGEARVHGSTPLRFEGAGI